MLRTFLLKSERMGGYGSRWRPWPNRRLSGNRRAGLVAKARLMTGETGRARVSTRGGGRGGIDARCMCRWMGGWGWEATYKQERSIRLVLSVENVITFFAHSLGTCRACYARRGILMFRHDDPRCINSFVAF